MTPAGHGGEYPLSITRASVFFFIRELVGIRRWLFFFLHHTHDLRVSAGTAKRMKNQ